MYIWDDLVSPVKGGWRFSQAILLSVGILQTLHHGGAGGKLLQKAEMECLSTHVLEHCREFKFFLKEQKWRTISCSHKFLGPWSCKFVRAAYRVQS